MKTISKDKFSKFDILSVLLVILGGSKLIALVVTSNSVENFSKAGTVTKDFGSVKTVARSLFGKAGEVGQHSFVFEALSVLLLAAIISAVVLAKKKL